MNDQAGSRKLSSRKDRSKVRKRVPDVDRGGMLKSLYTRNQFTVFTDEFVYITNVPSNDILLREYAGKSLLSARQLAETIRARGEKLKNAV